MSSNVMPLKIEGTGTETLFDVDAERSVVAAVLLVAGVREVEVEAAGAAGLPKEKPPVAGAGAGVAAAGAAGLLPKAKPPAGAVGAAAGLSVAGAAAGASFFSAGFPKLKPVDTQQNL